MISQIVRNVRQQHWNVAKYFKISKIIEISRCYCTIKDHTCTIGFIGGGNIARAIGKGIIKKELLDPSEIYVSEPYVPMQKPWVDMGVNVTTKNGLVVENCEVIFLSIKTTALNTAVAGIKSTLSKPVEDKLFVSALAGIPLSTLQKMILPVIPNARIVRSTLNTPLLVGAGCTVLSGDELVTKEDLIQLKRIMSAIGMCHVVPESQLNAIGGLVGCGPAYMFVILEALSDGAVKVGMPRDLALRFAAQTMYGAAKMMLDTGKHPGELKDQVCSPGGTTIHGVHAMERGGVRNSLIDAVEKAVERANEIARDQ